RFFSVLTCRAGACPEPPPAIAKDTPATPNAGKDFRRRFRFEACFACAILEISYVCEKMLNEWNRTRSTNPFVNADYNMSAIAQKQTTPSRGSGPQRRRTALCRVPVPARDL